MALNTIYRFEQNGGRFAIDTETCFCFECDEISWDVLDYYPEASVTHICEELGSRHDVRELHEVVGELEWLRSTKSILAPQPVQDFFKQFEIEQGLKRLTVRLPHGEAAGPAKRGWFKGGASEPAAAGLQELGKNAVDVLLARSGSQPELLLELLETQSIRDPEAIGALCAHALRVAQWSGKKLTVAVRVEDLDLAAGNGALAGHALSLRMEFSEGADPLPHVQALAKLKGANLARAAKLAHPDTEGVGGRIIIRPAHPDFGEVVPALHDAGFKVIELDLDGAYAADPNLDPAAMLDGLRQTAVYYAKRLLGGDTFRLDPIAALFYRIHEGKAVRRSDPAGTNELAVDSDGAVYASWRLLGKPEFRVGELREEGIDGEALLPYEDIGSLTTGVCRCCWARNLCGGGAAAVHNALSGSFRMPHEPWCEAQRAWMESAVAAFNLLSSKGVNFTRVYQAISGKKKKLGASLLTMAKAALQLTVLMRPVEENDAEMLVKWENWSDASYFTLHPKSLLLGTEYDREMDALHPRGFEQEMIITRRNGTPIGLLRFGPGQAPQSAEGSVFLADEKHYQAEDIRKGFRMLLREAGKQQDLRSFLIPVAERETAFCDFLTALGFERCGTYREALYLHDGRHDVVLYVLRLQ